MADRAQEVADFKARVFSGYDLLQLMDAVGVGVGATEMLVKEAEIKHEKHPDTYRALDGPRLQDEMQQTRQTLRACVGALTHGVPAAVRGELIDKARSLY